MVNTITYLSIKVFIHFIIAIGFCLLFAGPAFTQANQTVSNGQTVPAVDLSAMGECVYSWTNSNPAIGLAASGTGSIPSFTAINNGTTPVTATITVTPQNKGFAYIANSSAGTVSAVNTLTNTVSAVIPAGKFPGIMALSHDQSRLYVLNSGDSSITTIDTKTNTAINTLHVPAPPPNTGYTALAVTLDGSKVILGIHTSVYVLDAVTGAFLSLYEIKGSTNNSYVFSLDGNTMYIAGGTNIGFYDVPLLNYYMQRAAQVQGYIFTAVEIFISKDGTKLYALNYRVNQVPAIWVLDIPSLDVVKIVDLSGEPSSNVTQSPDGRFLYIHTLDKAMSSYVAVIDMTTYNEVARIPVPHYLTNDMAIAPTGSLLYVQGRQSPLVTIIDTKLNAVTGSILLNHQAGSGGQFVTGNCDPFSYTITVYPNPVITTTGNLPALSTVYGTPSATGSFTVTGAYIVGDILTTAPPGFEISTDNTNFGNSVTIAGSNTGVVTNAPIYIRLAKATPAGTYQGNITLTCGQTTVQVNQPTSLVAPAPLVITADNKTQFYGLNPPLLTATYKGFVNNDTTLNLVTLPFLTTTATAGSAPGQYPITVSGAVSSNYTITYVPGTLSILPLSAIVVPNAFTPNGDGINDTWNIKSIENYPDFTIQVINRYGQRVYYSHNYPTPWDGSFKNAPLPFGTYYYVITLGREKLTGYVAIVR